MAIRTINYTVTASGISPPTQQQGGVQGEHNATELIFCLDKDMLSAVRDTAAELNAESVVYRFDGHTGTGNKSSTEPQTLPDGDAVRLTYLLENWLTRDGGIIQVYLVITAIKEDKTQLDLYGFPALIRLKNTPDSEDIDGENHESITTLSVAAKNAAERAEESAKIAAAAQGKTEDARIAIEEGSTIVFNGNETSGEIGVRFVVDNVLSEVSENAIANKAVAVKFKETESNIKDIIDENAKNTKVELDDRELLSNKVDSFSEDITEDDAKTQYPSIECLKNTVHIVESGKSGDIWNYRKWSDGTAECWGKKEYELVATNLKGSVYFSEPYNEALPSGLFTDISGVSISQNDTWSWVGYGSASASITAVAFRLLMAEKWPVTPDVHTSVTVFFTIIGKWK